MAKSKGLGKRKRASSSTSSAQEITVLEENSRTTANQKILNDQVWFIICDFLTDSIAGYRSGKADEVSPLEAFSLTCRRFRTIALDVRFRNVHLCAVDDSVNEVLKRYPLSKNVASKIRSFSCITIGPADRNDRSKFQTPIITKVDLVAVNLARALKEMTNLTRLDVRIGRIQAERMEVWMRKTRWIFPNVRTLVVGCCGFLIAACPNLKHLIATEEPQAWLAGDGTYEEAIDHLRAANNITRLDVFAGLDRGNLRAWAVDFPNLQHLGLLGRMEMYNVREIRHDLQRFPNLKHVTFPAPQWCPRAPIAGRFSMEWSHLSPNLQAYDVESALLFFDCEEEGEDLRYAYIRSQQRMDSHPEPHFELLSQIATRIPNITSFRMGEKNLFQIHQHPDHDKWCAIWTIGEWEPRPFIQPIPVLCSHKPCMDMRDGTFPIRKAFVARTRQGWMTVREPTEFANHRGKSILRRLEHEYIHDQLITRMDIENSKKTIPKDAFAKDDGLVSLTLEVSGPANVPLSAHFGPGLGPAQVPAAAPTQGNANAGAATAQTVSTVIATVNNNAPAHAPAASSNSQAAANNTPGTSGTSGNST